jgi:23S rRNA pseudouridine1911/1915/1917 synthase
MQKRIIYDKKEKSRIDCYLAIIYKNKYSRSYLKKLINRGFVFVNEKLILSCNYMLKYTDEIVIKLNNNNLKKNKINFNNIKLEVIYEDNDLIIINKTYGIVVHPSVGHLSDTLLNLLNVYACGKYIPHLVHRLDKDTSGVIIFAKNKKSKEYIVKQFKDRKIKKIYYTVVYGNFLEDKGIIKAPLSRSIHNRKNISVNHFAKKMAITEFEVISKNFEYSVLKVKIITGRTHQIRSHMKYIHHPILGDRQYGWNIKKKINGNYYYRQMLHSYMIEFVHPTTLKTVNFIANIPDDMISLFK